MHTLQEFVEEKCQQIKNNNQEAKNELDKLAEIAFEMEDMYDVMWYIRAARDIAILSGDRKNATAIKNAKETREAFKEKYE